MLCKANATPSEAECREWIKKGILNEQMKLALTNYILYIDETPTHDQMLNHLRKYLRTQGEDSDPYKTSFTSPNKPLVAAAVISDNKWNGSTRCWRQGHHWSKCTEKYCSQCHNSLLNQFFCSNWRNHTDKRTRWAPRKVQAIGGSPNVTPMNTSAAHTSVPQVTHNLADQIKNTRKALNALIKSAKRQKTSESS